MTVSEFKKLLAHYDGKMEKIKRDKWIKYHRIFCGFDIETTAYEGHAYMYIWQFSYMTDTQPVVVVKGRTWYDFIELLRFLRVRFALRDTTRIIIWVANLGYEFSFMRKYLDIDFVFAKTPRNPLIVLTGGIEFRECLSISQGSLSYLAKTWTTTQKMVGDLDYSIIRNSLTPLDPTEEKYCDNDVIILAEFSKIIFNDYLKKERYIPTTSTGILRHDLKVYARASVDKVEQLYDYIKSLYPKTKSDYIYIMEYLFRGGYVHACYKHAYKTLYNMDSYDLKSSYPAVALQCYYPISEFKQCTVLTEERFNFLCKEYCVIFQATFENIRATTHHSIESKSKTISLTKPLLDNGRVKSAEKMTVFLTELDYETYKEFYEWDNMTIHTIHVANRGYLPRYLTDRFYYWFEKKENIDSEKNPQEYAIVKTRINGHFGMCVTRLIFNDITYNEGEWHTTPTDKSYDEMISKEVLSPYWGVYITAHARRRELMLLYKMKDEVVYSDTDSHKLFTNEHTKKVIEEYNNMISELNKEVSERCGYDLKVIRKLGRFECETENNHIKRFKTLGAKRYITEYDDGTISTTISGLPKTSLKEYSKAIGVDVFKIFENEMCIPSEHTHKLVSIYNDEPYTDIITDPYGNTERMREESGIYLKPSDFNLSIESEYLKLLCFWLERIEMNG